MSDAYWDVRAVRRERIVRRWPSGGHLRADAAIVRVGHVDVTITDALPRTQTTEIIRELLAGAPTSMAMAMTLRRLVVCATHERPALPAGAPRPPALCDLRGGIWYLVDARAPERSLGPELFHHELAHCAGGLHGGPPDADADAWGAAQEHDEGHARRHLRIGAPVILGGLILGGRSVTTYGVDEGPVEDWADAVALYLREVRLGAALIPAGLADEAAPTRRPAGPVRFADLWPARAALISTFLSPTAPVAA